MVGHKSILLVIGGLLLVALIFFAGTYVVDNVTQYKKDEGALNVLMVCDDGVETLALNKMPTISMDHAIYSNTLLKKTYLDLYDEIINSTSYWIYKHPIKIGPVGELFTIYKIKIIKVIKGEVKSQYIYLFSMFEGYDPLDNDMKPIQGIMISMNHNKPFIPLFSAS